MSTRRKPLSHLILASVPSWSYSIKGHVKDLCRFSFSGGSRQENLIFGSQVLIQVLTVSFFSGFFKGFPTRVLVELLLHYLPLFLLEALQQTASIEKKWNMNPFQNRERSRSSSRKQPQTLDVFVKLGENFLAVNEWNQFEKFACRAPRRAGKHIGSTT